MSKVLARKVPNRELDEVAASGGAANGSYLRSRKLQNIQHVQQT